MPSQSECDQFTSAGKPCNMKYPRQFTSSWLQQTAFHASWSNNDTADKYTLKISRGTSVVRIEYCEDSSCMTDDERFSFLSTCCTSSFNSSLTPIFMPAYPSKLSTRNPTLASWLTSWEGQVVLTPAVLEMILTTRRHRGLRQNVSRGRSTSEGDGGQVRARKPVQLNRRIVTRERALFPLVKAATKLTTMLTTSLELEILECSPAVQPALGHLVRRIEA